jgi:hypothetical protein
VGAARQALPPRLLPSRHFLGQQEPEEVYVRPAFLLRLHGDLLVDAAHVRQVETLEQSLAFPLGEAPALKNSIVGGAIHGFTPWEKRFPGLAWVPAPRTSATSDGSPS